MPLIEGVGDEVTNFMIVMMVILIGILSWWSTSITDQPLIRTVLILEPHNRHRLVRTTVRAATVTVSTTAEDTGQSETNMTERNHSESVSEAAIESHESNETKIQNSTKKPPNGQDVDPGPGSSTQPGQASTSTSEATGVAKDFVSKHEGASTQPDENSISNDTGKNEIRRRRLQFFQERLEIQQVNTNEGDPPALTATCQDDEHEKSEGNGSPEHLPEEAESKQISNNSSCSSEINERSNIKSCSKADETSRSEQVFCDPENCIVETCLKRPSRECAHETNSCSCPQSHNIVPESSNHPNNSKPEELLPNLDDIRIRLKYLNDDQKLVQGKLQEQLGDFKRRHFAVELEGNKVVRLIFNGQVLNSDDQTLQTYGLFDNCVVHCLVHSRRTTAANAEVTLNNNNVEDESIGANGGAAHREWDLSQLLYIGLSGILTMAWVLRFSNPLIFSATSTIALFGLTGVYVISVVGMYIPDPEGLRTFQNPCAGYMHAFADYSR